ncbi:MAG: DUF2156 domain-containing protein [Rhodobacteraceae bacterium]|nr:phosphatidylglycerol lysyltransferase domain-containing protein [uncultured Defluviimonas sp.]MCB2126538.1 DUF2156 domain-containing protein [Paracoccaceae bacterium]MCC0070485.1 DUF2156 domain-containing protein [Paracoccaceae bacterium]
MADRVAGGRPGAERPVTPRRLALRAAGLRAGAKAPGLAGVARRQIVPLMAAVLLLVLLRDRLAAIDPGAVRDAFGRIGPAQWLGATAATAMSFRALGRYDAVVHRFLGTGVGPAEAHGAGMTAIAISQTTGFGLATGALVRWRMLPTLGLGRAVRLTAAVTAWFLAAWATLTAAVVLVVVRSGPLAEPWATAISALVLLAATAGFGAALLAPEVSAFGRRLPLPPVPALASLLLHVAVDTLAAALALWLLLPPGVPIGPLALAAAYLVALGAGIVLATPGGIGPFEFALLALLPGADAAAVLGSVLAFRLVYFAAPAIIATVALGLGPRIFGPVRQRQAGAATLIAPAATATPETQALLAAAARAESGVLRQAEHAFLRSSDGRDGWVVGRGNASLIALFDPIGGAAAATTLLPALAAAARAADLVPCLYKCSARTAVLARRAGWAVRPVAAEQVLSPQDLQGFAGPRLAGLRRKLGKADRAGVKIARAAEGVLPMAELAALAAVWAKARGGERGFSMGRFAPDYIRAQRLYLARREGRTVAFISFHEGRREWTLDLMRSLPDAPDGTMHALVARAIEEAAAAGVARVSLAALPLAPRPGCRGRTAAVARWLRPNGDGLARFKSAFAPRAETLYIAAPSRPALALAVLDLLRAVHRPPPLPAGGGWADDPADAPCHTCRPAGPATRRRSLPRLSPAQDHPDEVRFDNRAGSWHMGPDGASAAPPPLAPKGTP